MLSPRRVGAALGALLVLVTLCGAPRDARADYVQGTSCTPPAAAGISGSTDGSSLVQPAGGNNLICVSGTWQYPNYILGTAAAAAGASCSGDPTGTLRYNTTVGSVEVCNGTNWTFLAPSSTSCGTPSGLSFTNVTGASLSTVYTSNTATITFSGCSGGSLSVSVSGASTAQISVNGGAWATSGAISSGQTLQVRLTSSAAASTLLTATVTVGSTSTNWTVTTAAADPCSVSSPAIGTVCTDGSIYAGITPDGSVKMFIAPCDAGMTGSAGSCTGTEVKQYFSAGDSVATGITNQATGKANTAALVADNGNADGPYQAASYCYNLNFLGHTDWYLPAVNELTVIATNYSALSGYQFGSALYPYVSSSASEGGPGNEGVWVEGISSNGALGNGTLCTAGNGTGCGGGYYRATPESVRCARHN